MTNTVFQCFKLDIFSISYQQAGVVEHWDFPNTEISSLKMSLQYVNEMPLRLRIQPLL
jgi:hypothetical protein